MAKYLVETITDGKTGQRAIIDASTPVAAATEAAGGEVKLRNEENVWIRVTPVAAQRSYQFVKA
jgi:hypothetical protein